MKIALTGGIAEGKSTVLSYLAQAGITVSSADQIAREVFNEPYIRRELSALVGSKKAVAAEELRSALGASIQLRREVNRVMHPAILARIRADVASVIEIPLLIETCLQGEFNRVWVVTCGREEQRRRLVNRLGDPVAADALIQAQLPTAAKTPFADIVFRTNCDEQDVQRCVMAVAQRSF